MAQNDKKQKNNPADSWSTRARHGRIVPVEFFKRHRNVIIAIIAMFLFYINNRYQCQTRMETIKDLTRELEVLQSEHVHQKSLYMSSTREAAMRELSDTLNLGLTIQERPPFKLHYTE